MNDFIESAGQMASEAADKAKETATAAAEKCEEMCASTTGEVENFVRRHPVWCVIGAMGIGYAVGMMARELLTPPPPPKNRALRVLEDIQGRLSDLAGPVYERASHYADEGIHAVKDGVHALGESRLANRIRHFFS